MATITKVDVKTSTWQGKEKKSYLFTLDDGKEGYSGNKDPWNFKEGDSVGYTLEVKHGKNGDYNVFTFAKQGASTSPQPQASPTPQSKVAQPNVKSIQSASSTEEMKFEARKVCMKLAVSAFIAGKLELAEVKTQFVDWTEAFDTAVDDINTSK